MEESNEGEKGVNILEQRTEWLLVADFHGCYVTNGLSGV